VSEQPEKAKVRWPSEPIPEGFELVRAQREVLLGAAPVVDLSRRATARLEALRDDMAGTVDPAGLVLASRSNSTRLWTWAGWRANATVIAGLGNDDATGDNFVIDLPAGIGATDIRKIDVSLALPGVTPAAVDGLKFSAALPYNLAVATLAARALDRFGASDVVGRPLVVSVQGEKVDASD
jgi:ATP-dependent Lhr-like helicase